MAWYCYADSDALLSANPDLREGDVVVITEDDSTFIIAGGYPVRFLSPQIQPELPTGKPLTTVLHCAHCGAPLAPPETGDRVKCVYCDAVNVIYRERAKPVATDVPVVTGGTDGDRAFDHVLGVLHRAGAIVDRTEREPTSGRIWNYYPRGTHNPGPG